MKNIFVLSIVVLLISCSGETSFTPKPRTYPRVVYPERTFQAFDANYCNFKFQHPTYTEIQKDEKFIDQKVPNECWFDVVYPQFDGRIHFTYQPIVTTDSLTKSISDAYEMAYKHTMRAEYIGETYVNNPVNKVYGVIYELEGRVASPFQFYLTDSTDHFLRGSLYFNTNPEPDSLHPVIEFVKEDIAVMLNSFEWQ